MKSPLKRDEQPEKRLRDEDHKTGVNTSMWKSKHLDKCHLEELRQTAHVVARRPVKQAMRQPRNQESRRCPKEVQRHHLLFPAPPPFPPKRTSNFARARHGSQVLSDDAPEVDWNLGVTRPRRYQPRLPMTATPLAFTTLSVAPWPEEPAEKIVHLPPGRNVMNRRTRRWW